MIILKNYLVSSLVFSVSYSVCCVKTFLLSFENHSQNVPLPTPKLHCCAIFQPAIPESWQECFYTTLYKGKCVCIVPEVLISRCRIADKSVLRLSHWTLDLITRCVTRWVARKMTFLEPLVHSKCALKKGFETNYSSPLTVRRVITLSIRTPKFFVILSAL